MADAPARRVLAADVRCRSRPSPPPSASRAAPSSPAGRRCRRARGRRSSRTTPRDPRPGVRGACASPRGSSRCRGVSTSPSVSKLAILPGPNAERWVDVKPRKSSAPSGISSAPRTPAAMASFRGSEPPTNPRRRLVTCRRPLLGRRSSASSMWARRSLRSRIATSLRLEHRALRVAREAAGVEQRGLAGPPVERQVRTGRSRDEPPEVRQAPRDGDAEPGGRRRVVGVEPGEQVLERAARVGEVAAVDEEARRHDLVVQRRHEHLDPVLAHDADALEEMLLRAAASPRPAPAAARRAGRRARRARRRPAPRRRRASAAAFGWRPRPAMVETLRLGRRTADRRSGRECAPRSCCRPFPEPRRGAAHGVPRARRQPGADDARALASPRGDASRARRRRRPCSCLRRSRPGGHAAGRGCRSRGRGQPGPSSFATRCCSCSPGSCSCCSATSSCSRWPCRRTTATRSGTTCRRRPRGPSSTRSTGSRTPRRCA